MNIAFFGSPFIAQTILDHIHRTHPVSLVVSQPDRPVGRNQIITPTAVTSWAMHQNIPFITELSDHVINTSLQQNAIDIAIVVAYGRIIKKQTLEIPRFGFINVHYSLLPKYRGASPVQFALLSGEHETGVTIMQIDEELDHGPIISQSTISISPDDTTGSLLEKLTRTSIPLLESILSEYEKNQPHTNIQDHSVATYTRRLTKQDGCIEFGTLAKAVRQKPLLPNDAPTIHNFIRAMSPWPGVWTIHPNGKRVKIISSTLRNGTLVITRHQEEGKTPVDTPPDFFEP